MKIALFIPVYNEEDNIYNLLEHCMKYIPKEDIYVLDNASTDNTVNLARLAGVNVRHNYKNLGIGGSLCHNLKHAPFGYDSIITMDAGWSHNPEDLPKFLKLSREFVVGYRYNWQAPLRRKIISLTARTILNHKYHTDIDWTSGFRNYPTDCLSELIIQGWFDKKHASGHAFQFEIAAAIDCLGWITYDVPIMHISSNRSLTWKVLWEAITTLWNL